MSGTYTTQAFCTNCGYEGPVEAEVGSFVYEQPCPLCVTKMLMPVAQRDWDRRVWNPDWTPDV